MKNLIYVFAAVAFLKLVFNIAKYAQCRIELRKYIEWLEKRDWKLMEHKYKVLKLLKGAGVPDSYLGTAEPVGMGYVQTANISVMENFPSFRKDFYGLMRGMFHQAIGTYRSRILDTFNPLYWIEVIVNLPRETLVYLGVPPERVIIKIAQLIYWIVAAVIGFLYALYKPDMEQIIRGWISRVAQ